MHIVLGIQYILDSSYGSFFFPDLVGFIWAVVVYGCSVFFLCSFSISIVSLCLMSPTFILLMAWWHTKAAKNEISKFSIDLVQWTMYFVLQRWPVSQGFLVSRYRRFCAKWKAAPAVTFRWSWCWCCWSWSSCCCCCCRPLSEFLFKECVCWQL